MTLADLKGGYLFESRPDLFPEGYLTEVELHLWGIYYDRKLKRLESAKG